jgi:very-short-patch-repair endonuclease
VEFHKPILGYEVDAWIIGTPVVLECDGWEFHDKRRRKFEDDRRRRAELTVAGYIVVHFTWTMLRRQPQWVAAMIRGAIARWSGDQR